MKNQLLILLIFMLTYHVSHGQEHAIAAANYLAEQNLTAAAKEINLALQDEQEKNDPYTWHINAYLLKEQYKLNPTGTNENRSLAILAAKKSLNLDKEKEFAEGTKKIIDYLAATYLKEAFLLSKSNDTTEIKLALGFFDEYQNSKKITTPEEDFIAQKHEVQLHVANQYQQLYYEKDKEYSYILKAINTYDLILQEDSMNYHSNYNISVNFYNLAVDEISKIDASTPFWELIYIQEHSIELFKKSLPYMLRAHHQKPDRLYTLKGLMQIYRALGNKEKFLEFKQKTEDNIRNQ